MPCWQRMLLQYWLPPSLGSPSGMLTLCRKFGRVAFGPIFEPKCSSSSCSLSSSSGGSEGRSCLPLAETSTLLQFQAHSCAVRAGGKRWARPKTAGQQRTSTGSWHCDLSWPGQSSYQGTPGQDHAMKQRAAAPLAPETEPTQSFKEHRSRSGSSASCMMQHRECSMARGASGMFLPPCEATAEDPAVCEDAEPDLAGCVHAVGVHPKVINEALHLDLQMPLGNSVVHLQAGARQSEHSSKHRGRISRDLDSRGLV